MLLRELIEQAISGADHAVVAEEREYVLAVQAEPDPAGKLALYAHAIRQVQARMAPLFLALRDAATTEPEASEVWQEISNRRAANMRKLALELQAAGGLRPGLSIDEAADVIWATNSSELYVLLTAERQWTADHYESWLADTWRRLLLPERTDNQNHASRPRPTAISRLPPPPVVVFAGDRLTVAGHAGGSVVVVAAVLARLVARPFVAHRVAARGRVAAWVGAAAGAVDGAAAGAVDGAAVVTAGAGIAGVAGADDTAGIATGRDRPLSRVGDSRWSIVTASITRAPLAI